MNQLLKLIGKDPIKSKKISYFTLQGQITTAMTYKVYKALKKFKPNNSRAIALIINSTGGSLAQAYIISKKFELLKQQYNIPIYTFAEDYALSSAFYLLALGDKIYCHKTSLVGGVGSQIQTLKIKQLLEYYKLEIRSFQSHQQQTFLNEIDPLDNITNFNISQQINDQQSQELERLLSQKIENRIKDKNTILNGQIYTGLEIYEQLKYIDGISNYLDILQQEYPDNKIINATQKTQKEKMMGFLEQLNS